MEGVRPEALRDAEDADVPNYKDVPLGLILRNSLDRPWLALYRDRSDAPDDAPHTSLALLLGDEVWLKICSFVGWLDLGRMACVCTALQRVTSSQSLWEPRCLRAWRQRGFRPCGPLLYAFGFSWKRMVRRPARARSHSPAPCAHALPAPRPRAAPQYLTRPRLRTDGVYLLEVSTFTAGMNEGRGMKELGRDFYRGKLVQSRYWRYVRFMPDGRLLTLTTWRPPLVAALLFAKAAHARSASEPALRRLGATLLGQYEVLSDDARTVVRLRASALVALDQYPRMRPSTVHYEFALCTRGCRGANNASLCLLSHYSLCELDGSEVVEHAVPPPGHFSFCSFDAARRAAASGHSTEPPPMPPMGSLAASTGPPERLAPVSESRAAGPIPA